ncbi:hypothetical protein SKAU_G00038260 [Synaphobranchus kaupii]|uniref:HECT-type E3 ubiquitin transferase n=1 Tax=Synaphobranchus kaupii TaxID=118154 RepID=A0A9Q1GGH6_SYNKA|nr:hypothetical protein SKAU_G00038260 [Synaphobranchus kaupii]
MRVYLILPELLRVLPMDRELCVKFSEAVCKLHPLNLKILEYFFKSLVKMVHSTSTWFLHQMRTEQRDFSISVGKTVAVLQKLYEVNYTAGRKIEDRNFYINEMKLFIQSVKFEDEDGIDHGGVSQEFFTIFAREIHSMEPRMLELHEDSRLVWFMPENAKYYAYEPTDENIQNFWTVFTELSEEKKKNFLSFMTGSDRLPVGGLAKIKLTIKKPNKPNPDDFYPVADTCYCCLHLPNYSSIHILREKFVHAISFYEEFGEK